MHDVNGYEDGARLGLLISSAIGTEVYHSIKMDALAILMSLNRCFTHEEVWNAFLLVRDLKRM